MSTDLSYIEYVLEQLKNCGQIQYRKMFGEYMIYSNAKPVLLICDNTVFMKKHDFLEEKNLSLGFPYKGAKEHYILDVDDSEFLSEAVRQAEKITPIPKKKQKKKEK